MEKRILINADARGGNHYHVGDEAMLTALLDYLRRPDIKIKVLSLDPSFTSKNLGVESVFKIFPIKEIIGCDLFLVSGGGNMNSSFKLYTFHQLCLILLAKIFGKKVVMVSQTIGPFNWLERIFAGPILNMVDAITVRDKKTSFETLNSMKVNEPIIKFAPDDAYFLKEYDSGKYKFGDDAIGICMHGLNEEEKKLFAEQFDNLSKKHTLVFIPYDMPEDVDMYEDIVSKMKNKEKTVVIKDCMDREIKHVTSKMNVVLATRYHAMIFAHSKNVPVIGMYKHRNYLGKLNSTPLAEREHIVQITKETIQELPSFVEELIKERKQISHELGRINSELTAKKDANKEMIFKMLMPVSTKMQSP